MYAFFYLIPNLFEKYVLLQQKKVAVRQPFLL